MLAVLGGVWFLGGCGSDVSEADPLGRFDKVDKELTGAGLKKIGSAAANWGFSAATGTFTDYAAEEAEQNSGFRQRVYVVQGADGKVLEIGGTFTPRGGSGTVRGFLSRRWQAVGGAAGADSFDGTRARGTWRKIEPSEVVTMTRK